MEMLQVHQLFPQKNQFAHFKNKLTPKDSRMFFHDFNSKFHDKLVSQFNSCVNSNKSVLIQTWVAKPKSLNYTLPTYTFTTLL